MSSITARRVLGVVLTIALLAMACTRDTALDARVEDLENRLAAAQTTIASLQTQMAYVSGAVTAISSNHALALDPYLTVDASGGKPVAVLSGINLQIVNGAGTALLKENGLGNLIIGYNERGGGREHCSKGTDAPFVPIVEAGACAAAGGTWGAELRTGSHYIVVGPYNDYTALGGVVFGTGNISDGQGANVLGGGGNEAAEWYATITGGSANSARGVFASAVGGFHNIVQGQSAVAVGGGGNTVTGSDAVAVGGSACTVSGSGAVAAGGSMNAASGDDSAVLGGSGLTASGPNQSIPPTP
jgi:hypothetical protein